MRVWKKIIWLCQEAILSVWNFSWVHVLWSIVLVAVYVPRMCADVCRGQRCIGGEGYIQQLPKFACVRAKPSMWNWADACTSPYPKCFRACLAAPDGIPCPWLGDVLDSIKSRSPCLLFGQLGNRIARTWFPMMLFGALWTGTTGSRKPDQGNPNFSSRLHKTGR